MVLFGVNAAQASCFLETYAGMPGGQEPRERSGRIQREGLFLWCLQFWQMGRLLSYFTGTSVRYRLLVTKQLYICALVYSALTRNILIQGRLSPGRSIL